MMITPEDKLAWVHLLNSGDVITEWNFYGGLFDIDPTATDKCLKEIQQHGIDWKKTKPVQEYMESSFVNTFADYVDKHIVMGGRLHLNNKSKYDWGKDEINVAEFVRSIVGLIDSNIIDSNITSIIREKAQ